MKSLSVGVRSNFSDVNCLSKLLTSLRCFCSPWCTCNPVPRTTSKCSSRTPAEIELDETRIKSDSGVRHKKKKGVRRRYRNEMN
ncbi:Uncharacterized protein APZ42_013580 [Daphnia magna]|uniref:Uncharacterized protein n=1 Tax=Daphnia magna TaxID=35525 RepID=A0A162QLK9_9CRUS|nr:Uncharacterized protein APZ42_013580 [Daphnia magna]